MKLERTRRAKQNIKAGLILKAYQMIVPFLLRTLMIQQMGVEYLGLNSLFGSILHVLNLAELGVGAAMVYSMYQPISEDNENRICALMRLYRRYYRMIGLVVGVLGLLLIPWIPELIQGDVPSELNITVLYLLNLSVTVLTYWLFAYKRCILEAHQRNSVIHYIALISHTIQYVLQAIVLLYIKNYYVYVMVLLFSTILDNLLTAVIASKAYPQYKAQGTLEKAEIKQINHRIRDLCMGKIAAVLSNNVDNIVISAFLGLRVLAVFQNYFFILKSVISTLEILFSSIMAGLGNSFLVDSKEKVFEDLKKFTFIYQWVIGICACCFMGLYQPFMRIWVGEELMMTQSMVVCFVVYFVVYMINRLLNVYKDAAGLWRVDRWRPLVAGFVNLFMNLLLVKRWGALGVLASTTFSQLFVGMPWLLYNLFHRLFVPELLTSYLKQLTGFTMAIFAACIMVFFACRRIDISPWADLVLCGMISVIIPMVLFGVLFSRSENFRNGKKFVKRIIGI